MILKNYYVILMVTIYYEQIKHDLETEDTT